MMYVAAITVVFLVAGLCLLSKLGAANSARLEAAAARSHAGRKVALGVQAAGNPYMHQFDELVNARH